MDEQKRAEAQQLLSKYLARECTEREKALVERFYQKELSEHAWPQDLSEDPQLKNEMWEAIQASTPTRVRRLNWRWSAAAAILIGVSFSIYYFQHKANNPPNNNNITQIKPGSNGAILTLANGQKIVLEDAKAGTIARQGNRTLNKAGDSLLVYQANQEQPAGTGYNTIETPRGRQYAIVLPDGSKAWLNAQSSLKYPVAFNGANRTVELTGEAYFEVVHNDRQPFRVQTQNETIEDIGTSFNVNAYADESQIKTTLLEGSVKVSIDQQDITLKPDQQAIVSNNKIKVKKVVAEDAIDWHQGYFRFGNEPLESAMRKIARWYNVEVEYQDESLKKINAYGTLDRVSDVSQVFDLFETTKAVKFKVDGKKIIVTKY